LQRTSTGSRERYQFKEKDLMADFRNKLLLCVGVSTLFAGLASAQTLSCTIGGGAVGVPVPAGANAVTTGFYGGAGTPGAGTIPTQPIELRSEGATELVSDTIFNCDAATTPLQGQVTAYLSGAVPGLSITSTAPVLQVIDNSAVPSHPTVYYSGTVVPGSSQVIFGTATSGPAIYTNTPVVFPQYDFILEVSNIRVNVTGLLNPTTPTPVSETVFAGAEGVATLFQSNAITVGYVLKSLNVTGTSPYGYVVCAANTQTAGPSFTVTVSELFAGAFKQPFTPSNLQTPTVVYPATIPGGEQGTLTSIGGTPLGIEATPLGTRIKFVVANIPAGVTGLSVPNSIETAQGADALGQTLTLDLVTGGDTGTAGPFGAAGSTTLPIASGSVTVIYQVDYADLTEIKTFNFSPTLIFAANAVLPTTSPITVTTSYSPSPATPGGALVIPTTYLPYFANTGTPLNANIFAACETDLLFPFVTTTFGYETGLAISNTAADPFGTVGQGGACNVYFYGTGQVPAATSPVTATATNLPAAGIAVGTTSTTVVSPFIGSAFTGYAIARCNFLFAHGYAFFTNAATAGSSGVAQGYMGLVLPHTPTVPRTAATGAAETLTE